MKQSSKVGRRQLKSGSDSSRISLRKRNIRGAVAAVLEPMESRLMMTAFAYTGSIETFEVTQTGAYVLTAAGAQGGSDPSPGPGPGGLGATLSGELTLTEGTVLSIVVGGMGVYGTGFPNGAPEGGAGGGGGTFVYISGSGLPLLVAGGGGGGGEYSSSGNAQLSSNGGTVAGYEPGTGGVSGAGGTGGAEGQDDGGGGTGFFSAGTGSAELQGQYSTGGLGGTNRPTFAGGAGDSAATEVSFPTPDGGFGGGGGGGVAGNGGGGGYSGGSGAGGGYYGSISDGGGGGGSYILSSLKDTSAQVNQTGNGYFTLVSALAAIPQTVNVTFDTPKPITLAGTDAGTPVTFAISSNVAHGTLTAFNPQTGSVSYTPTAGYVGTDSFTFTAVAGTITSVPATVTINVAAPSATPWMAGLPDIYPLTDISLPGTYQSASGPGLQDALLGAGSSDEVNSPTLTGAVVGDAGLAAELAADVADEAAIVAGGKNAGLNSAAIAANSAALATEAAAGITQTSTGAGLAIGLAADIADLASTIAGAAQGALSNDDTAAISAQQLLAQDEETEATEYATASGDNATAGGDDSIAGTDDSLSGTADTLAGTDDGLAGGADAASGGGDAAAATSNAVSALQGSIDPVADGISAGLDVTATGLDALGTAADTTAAASDTAADITNGTASGADVTAAGVDTTAVSMDSMATGAEMTAKGDRPAVETDFEKELTNHALAASADGVSASAYVLSAASDGYEAAEYSTFANTSHPALTTTSGGNPNNTYFQNVVYGDAVAGATAHTMSATAETLAAGADSLAAQMDLSAGALDQAALNAIEAASILDNTAETDDAAASQADGLAETENEMASTEDLSAITENTLAGGLDASSGGLDLTAGIADGVAGGANTAAATADSIAIGLDITALATIEIPFVDIGTAAAAAIADGVAAAADVTADASDVAADVADGLATADDITSTLDDGLATTQDGMAAGIDATAATDDALATTADTAATAADTAASEADAAADAAIKAAINANKAADAQDTLAGNFNTAATVANVTAVTADINFTGETQTIQNTQIALQTQTLSIGDQLAEGVRSLDLRTGLVNDTINLNTVGNDPNNPTTNPQYFTGTTLKDALNDATSFLHNNPSETVVISLSNTAAEIGSSSSFNADFNNLMISSDSAVTGKTYGDFVYQSSTPNNVPDLNSVRGRIVFIVAPGGGWTGSSTNTYIGWHPTEVDQDTHTDTDPNTRWNDAQSDNGAGLIPTDLGTPTTLYRNNLTQDAVLSPINAITAAPIQLGDTVNGIADQYFGQVKVTRTAGIVGINDPDPTLINEIIAQNNAPIIVTSDSDAPGVTGTLRDAILQANSQPGINTIEFASALTGTTGNAIVLQSDLPTITNDLNVGGSVFINDNGFTDLVAAANHTVTETKYVASSSGLTPQTSTANTPVYLDKSGLTIVMPAPVSVNPVNITYGTALTNSQLQGTATVNTSGGTTSIAGTFTFNGSNGVVLHAGSNQVESVRFTPTDTTDYQIEYGTVIVNVAKAQPSIVIPPISITYGTALTNSQITAISKVPGAFTFDTAGVVPNTGSSLAEAITFTPTDTTDYTTVHSTVLVTVTQATPIVAVSPIMLPPGTALDNSQLNGTANFSSGENTLAVPGTFTFTTANGTVPTGGVHSEAVTFAPTDTVDFMNVSSSVMVTVAQAQPVIPAVAVNADNIIYGTPLSNSQLVGSATYNVSGNLVSVAGTFAFNGAAGTVLSGGNGQSENAIFTPTDTTDYAATSLNVTVNVAQGTPTIATLNPVNIGYQTPFDNSQISGSATYNLGGSTIAVPGTFAYTNTSGGLLHAGNGQSESVTFTPTDTTDFTSTTANVTVNVSPVMLTVASVTPVSITYGTALNNAQLSGVAVYTVNGNSTPVAGTFSYNNAGGTLLNAGTGQTAGVTFTPTDSNDFTTASSSVTINVAAFTPTVTITDAGGPFTGSAYPATGTATGAGGANLGSPTFAYYLATDTSFTNPLSGVPTGIGRYIAAASYAANGNYTAAGATTSFSIYNGNPPITPTVSNIPQPATAPVGTSVTDMATIIGNNPTGVVRFRLYSNATATGPALFTDTETLSGGVATSKPYLTTAASIGADHWVVVYSGDSANNPVTTAATAGPLTVGGSLIVNSTGDGPTATGNTLRDAIAYANTLGAGTHLVTFDPTVFATGQTITLTGTLGAIVLSDAAGTITVTGPAAGVTISGGNSTEIFNVSSGTTAALSGLTMVNGNATNGGAIFDKGVLTIMGSTFSENIATSLGGAIAVSGSLTLINSTLTSNTASIGGAIEDVGSVTVIDSTLTANQAGTGANGGGGAIDNSGTASALMIGNSIIAGNSAGFGPDVSNTVISLGNNLIGEANGSTGWIASDLTGTVAQPLNPLLGTLSSNGGPTQTIPLLPGSPALGAGAIIDGITLDQRGIARPSTHTDIGALQTIPATTSVVIPAIHGVYTGLAFQATGSVTGPSGVIAGASITFTYYNASDTGFTNPLSAAPTNVGSYVVVGQYSGNASFAPARATSTLFITAASTTVALTSSTGGSSFYGQSVTFRVVISVVAPGGGTPTGSVTFFSNGINLGTVPVVNGIASLTTSTLSIGRDPIAVTYVPDTGDFTSKKASLMQTVTPTAPAMVSETTGTVNGDAAATPLAFDFSSTPAINQNEPGSTQTAVTEIVANAASTGDSAVSTTPLSTPQPTVDVGSNVTLKPEVAVCEISLDEATSMMVLTDK